MEIYLSREAHERIHKGDGRVVQQIVAGAREPLMWQRLHDKFEITRLSINQRLARLEKYDCLCNA